MLLAANLADDADTGSSSDGAARRRPLRPERHPRPLAGTRCLEGIDSWQRRGGCCRNPLPTGRSWVGSRSTALDPVANTDTKLLILWSVSKGRVLAQDAVRIFGHDALAVSSAVTRNSSGASSRIVISFAVPAYR